MDLHFQQLLLNARKAMLEWGGVEIPPYPGSLLHYWTHPDLAIRMFGPAPHQLFFFQPLLPARRTALEPAIPRLVCFQKPFRNDWLLKMPPFISSLVTNKTPEGKAGSPDQETPSPTCLEVIGTIGKSGLFSDFDPAWNLYWKGYEIGEARVFTTIFDEKLEKPCGVAVFNLGALLKIGNLNFDLPSIPWDQTLSCGDILSLRPFPFSSGVFGKKCLQDCNLETLKERAEDLISRRRYLEAYQTILEGHQYHHLNHSLTPEDRSTPFDALFKPVLKRLAFGIPALQAQMANEARETT